MSGFVIDASLAAAWFLPDEDSADGLLRRLDGEEALVPSLFWHEMRNILLGAARRKRIRAENILLHLEQLRALPIRDCGHGADPDVMGFAIQYALTAYDAAYLDLARKAGMPLATRDQALGAAALAEGVEVLTR